MKHLSQIFWFHCRYTVDPGTGSEYTYVFGHCRPSQLFVHGRERSASAHGEFEISGVIGRQPVFAAKCQRCFEHRGRGSRRIDIDWQSVQIIQK